jgi:thiol-disulfide isomerase/thioredoxin
VSGSVWVASYVLLWIAVLVLSVLVIALLRQVGVLHARLRPMGVHFAGEGPERLKPAPALDGVSWSDRRMTLVAFTSPTCEICKGLVPALQVLDRQYPDVGLVVLDHGPETAATFAAFNVSSTPYVVAVDGDGVVQGRGVANSLEQVEVLLEEALVVGR